MGGSSVVTKAASITGGWCGGYSKAKFREAKLEAAWHALLSRGSFALSRCSCYQLSLLLSAIAATMKHAQWLVWQSIFVDEDDRLYPMPSRGRIARYWHVCVTAHRYRN